MPTCREVQTLATEYREGTLPFSRRLGIGLHLLLCWACRAFLRGLEALPGLSKKVLKEREAPPEAQDALAAALKEIRR
jgi:anti-sigma factor ChrR (cupin superfamily)